MTSKMQAGTGPDVDAVIKAIGSDKKRQDALQLLDIFKQTTQQIAQYWPTNMIGFGKYDYTYASGHSGSCFRSGFSPRKQNFSLYIMTGVVNHPELLMRLGKHKTGKSCLYINRLADVDLDVLTQIIAADWLLMAEKYPL